MQRRILHRAFMLFPLATALLAGSIPAAHAQLPKKPAPQGMVELPAGGTTGRILTSRMGGTNSARKMLIALKMVSGEYFDKPFTVTRAFADSADQNLQAAFTAKLKGIPVRGVAAVVMQGEGGQGSLVFDDAKKFAKTFRLLTAKLNGGGKAGQPKATPHVTLTPHTAPDGSCTISLPPGFRITGAFKGTLDVIGPNNAVMALGAPALCTRAGRWQMSQDLPSVSFEDPVQAMIDYANFLGRRSGTNVRVRVLDYKPVQGLPNGRAAFVRYNIQAAGKSFEGFGLFSITPTDENQALFYQSSIVAPTETYRSQFPGMLRAWKTWSINPGVFQERLVAAAESMRGMSDIITGSNANRQSTYAKVNEAWSDYIRDQSTWSNPTTGNQYKLPNNVTNDAIPMQNGVSLEPVPLSGL